MLDRTAMERELSTLAAAARQRRSVDLFLRAAVEGFCWAVLSGICGKLLWDSATPPLFFWPLALLVVLLLWDAVRSSREGRGGLRRGRALGAGGRGLRSELGMRPCTRP